MEETSHLEYRVWMEWLAQQWNKPTLTDHYLMQVAQEVNEGNYRKVRKLESFKLPFGVVEEEAPKTQAQIEAERAQHTMWSKSIWFGALGISEES